MSSEITPARLEEIASLTREDIDAHAIVRTHRVMAALYSSPALAARVIELEKENDRLREALGDMLDDCEPDRPGAPRLNIREAARAALKGGDYGA